MKKRRREEKVQLTGAHLEQFTNVAFGHMIGGLKFLTIEEIMADRSLLWQKFGEEKTPGI
jgi:hypothetical protein